MITRGICACAALLMACGAPQAGAGEPHADREHGDPSQEPAAGCSWDVYQPPEGCYVADLQGELQDLAPTVADAETLDRILRPYPAEANRSPCDPSAVAASFDFGRQRIFIGWVRDAYEMTMLVPLRARRVECLSDVTRIVVSLDRWCGGTERSPGRVMFVVPAGTTPIELVNEGSDRCEGLLVASTL